MLEEPKIKKVDKRDKQLPQNFEQLIEMYDVEKIWPFILKTIQFINKEIPEDFKELIEKYELEDILKFFNSASKLMDFNASGKGMGIGKVSEKDALEIALPTEFNKQTRMYKSTSGEQTFYWAKRTDTDVEVGVGVGTGGVNHGVFSNKLNKWLVYGDGSNVYLNGNAETATKATQDANGKNIAEGYTRAGSADNTSLSTIGSGALYRSGLYTVYDGSQWWNLINIRHRNGSGDGTSYGMQIRNALTSSPSNLQVRQQNNGAWGSWRTLVEKDSDTSLNILTVGDLYVANAKVPAVTSGANEVYFGSASSSTGKTTALRGNTVRLYAHSGGAVYLGYSGSTAVTSDENLKDIYEIDNKYIEFFNNLKPITYIYKNKGHRNHMGFGARQVEEALIKAGLTTEQFAGVLKDTDITISSDEMGTEEDIHYDELYSLRYEEFIALNTMMIQKQAKQIEEQNNLIADLNARIEILEKQAGIC